MLTFTEKKKVAKSCSIEMNKELNKEIIDEGCQTELSVSIDGMLNRPVQNNGELNGEVGTYRAKFTVNNNRIFAVRDLTIFDSTNAGPNPTNEYRTGEEHIGRVNLGELHIFYTDSMIHCLVDENQVTLTVQNPGGTLNLTVNYTLISERPIELQDVVTEVEEGAKYQVAQVGFS